MTHFTEPILKTVGNETNFNRKVDAFMHYPDKVKKKANAKLLIPFFIIGVIAFGRAISKF